ncbi:MAG: GNAT family N-acetyltransferase [Hyphomicrobiales bacterium]|nr:GNAT family N-acetyltransferase [Hyphomicrobiales bacterium]
MRVRPAHPKDMGAVSAMARALADHVDDPDPGDGADALIRSGFGAERWFECLVVETEGDKLVGFALACRRYEAHRGRRSLWIGDLYVSSSARRTGAGRAMLLALAGHAEALGCTHITFELWRKNELARAFYAELGAREDAEVAPMAMAIGDLTAQLRG